MSLENFKKQAKLLVRWHRERNYSVGGRIRRLSRYKELTDSEALALPFPLHEAQEVIALEQGYPSWAELKEAFISGKLQATFILAPPRRVREVPAGFAQALGLLRHGSACKAPLAG